MPLMLTNIQQYLYLDWEDPLEKGKAIHSLFWPGDFHGQYSPCSLKESDMTE